MTRLDQFKTLRQCFVTFHSICLSIFERVTYAQKPPPHFYGTQLYSRHFLLGTRFGPYKSYFYGPKARWNVEGIFFSLSFPDVSIFHLWNLSICMFRKLPIFRIYLHTFWNSVYRWTSSIGVRLRLSIIHNLNLVI